MNSSRYQLPVADTIKASWQKVYGAKKVILLAFITLCLIGFVKDLCDKMLSESLIKAIFDLFMAVIEFLFSAGASYIGIVRAGDSPIRYSMIFRSFEKRIALNIIVYLIVTGSIFIILFAMFFVLGSHLMDIGNKIAGVSLIVLTALLLFYFLLRISIAQAYILDKNLGFWTAIKSSFRATRSNVWRLVVIYLYCLLLIIVVILTLGVALIWVVPFLYILHGLIYKRLAENNA